MIPPLHEMAKYFAPEDLTEAGFGIYPVLANETSNDLLAQYHAETSLDACEEIEKRLLCSSCFHGDNEAFNAFINERSAITLQIAKIEKILRITTKPFLEEELLNLVGKLSALENATAKKLWMTDTEMQVHRDCMKRGFPLPPIWNQLVSLVRKDYRLMADITYKEIQMQARTTGGCDELRFDMLRHTVYLLKYYGFTCTKSESIRHPFQQMPHAEEDGRKRYKGGFSYNLLNPTWEHLEDEIRTDLKNTGMQEDQVPPRYPDTPSIKPSPVKDNEISNNVKIIALMGFSLPRMKGVQEEFLF